MKRRESNRIHFKEILLNVFHQKKLIMILLMFVFISIITVIIYFSFFSSPLNLICGDDTIYDSCSDRKPYFCERGVLIERASICGCFENLTINGDSCFSEHQTGIKSITLNYILRGKNETIDFVVYDGLANYLSKLPRSIHHVDGELPTKKDFKIRKLDEEEQRYLLFPLVTKIQNLVNDEKDQVRIAISLIQKIPFGSSDKSIRISGNKIDYARYPYEVLYEGQGVCGEKSELLAFILREMGYGVGFFYYPLENHEAVAVKCPIWHSVRRTGYCLIETTGPSIMTDEEIEYVGVGKLSSEPELIVISEGKSIGNWWYEYNDARKLKEIRKGFGIFNERKLEELREKYDLVDSYNI